MRRRIRIAIVIVALVLAACTGFLIRHSTGAAKLSVTFSHFETHRGHDNAVIQITNYGDRSASMYGYGTDAPFYHIVTNTGTNWSWDYTPGFDWDQERPIVLTPGASMSVRSGVPIPDEWMVGVSYRDTSFADRLPRILWRWLSRVPICRNAYDVAWSGPLTRDSTPRNTVPPLVTNP
jgi:hypothetical protein